MNAKKTVRRMEFWAGISFAVIFGIVGILNALFADKWQAAVLLLVAATVVGVAWHKLRAEDV